MPSREPIFRLGLMFQRYDPPSRDGTELVDRLMEVARSAEETGFDALFAMDHLLQIPGLGGGRHPVLEAYTLLGALSVETRRVKLGALVTSSSFRNPAMLAKMVTTIDVLSQGRAILGIGAGWYAEEEHAYGYPKLRQAERFTLLETTVKVCRAMFEDTLGKTVTAPNSKVEMYNVPSPLQQGGPPLLIGGGGELKTLPLVARYADICNLLALPDDVAQKLHVLRDRCADIGRDYESITKTWVGQLFLGATEREVQTKLTALAELCGRPTESPAQARARGALAGTPRQVAGQVEQLLEAGLDGIVVTMPSDIFEESAIANAANVLFDLLRG